MNVLRWTALLLLTACTPSVQPAGQPSGDATASTRERRPDILLISIDSLRHDHLGCYGYPKPTSPNIDRIASEGLRFERVVSTTSWTLPAHMALMSGMYDSAHGVTDKDRALSPKVPLLAEMVRDAGYHTIGFYGGPYLHPVFGFARGFERYVDCMSWTGGANTDDAVRRALDPNETASHHDITGPRTLAALERELESAPAERPLFAFVHLWDVHYDYIPPESYWRRFDPDYTGSLDARDFMHNKAIHAGMPARELEHVIALYDGEIAFTDEIVGKMLAAWGKKRSLDDTLVVITADHGEEFFEHRNKGHMKSLFHEVVRVPLVLRWPGRLRAGSSSSELVSTIDVMPTLAAAAGVEEALKVEGRDLAPLFDGRPIEGRNALSELLADRMDMRALRTPTTRVYRWKPGQYFGTDFHDDPKEMKPLAPQDPDVVAGAKELEAALARTSSFARALGAPPEPVRLDEKLRQSLRGLGYDGGDEDEPR